MADTINTVIDERNLSPFEVLKSRKEINELYRIEANRDISNSYGIDITNFSIRLNSKEYDDYTEAALTGAKKENELSSQGRYYDSERQYDIMQRAADNPGAGTTMGVGVGFGIGNNLGNMIGQMMGNIPSVPGNVPPVISYHFVINGQATGALTYDVIKQYITQGVITPNTLVWCQGMSGWMQAGNVAEFSALFVPTNPDSQLPPPVPNQ